MPSKNRVKPYTEDGYYHLYNRGADKRPIFIEEQDYLVLISYLQEYLSPPVPPSEEEIRIKKHPYIRKNYFGNIEMIAFCLMPNHFHFLLKQDQSHTIVDFMRSVFVRYSIYFNRHHGKIGHIFQDAYKGILIQNDEYLWWLSRYIHLNPAEFLKEKPLLNYSHSSYSSYVGASHPKWLHPEMILGNFKDYRSFVENPPQDEIPEFLEDYYLE